MNVRSVECRVKTKVGTRKLDAPRFRSADKLRKADVDRSEREECVAIEGRKWLTWATATTEVVQSTFIAHLHLLHRHKLTHSLLRGGEWTWRRRVLSLWEVRQTRIVRRAAESLNNWNVEPRFVEWLAPRGARTAQARKVGGT